jgi:DNA-binding CsgD family transcriptional regulator
MPSQKHDSFLGVLGKLSKKDFDPQQLDIDDIVKMLIPNLNFYSFLSYNIPMMYLLDYSVGKYLSVSKTSQIVLGYKSTELTENGLSFTIDHYSKDDLKLYNERLLPDRLRILKSIPINEHPNYIFTNNLRCKNSEGELVNLLQRICFVKSDPNAVPLLGLAIVTKVEHYIKGDTVTQLVEKIIPDDFTTETFYKKIYYLNEESNILSKREREVLLWVAAGLVSKEIANKLFISEDTVINHRKNMLLKSGTKNAAELVSFAMRNHLI